MQNIMLPKKILFVCTGNICRSPLAEGIAEHYIKEYNLPLIVDSAAIEPYHIGQNPDKRTIDNAKTHHIDISHLIARQIKPSDLIEFDKIYVMENYHYAYLKKLSPYPHIHQKIDYLMNILYPGRNMEVPDPYYGSDKDFEEVFQMIHASIQKLIEPYILLSSQKNFYYK